MAKPRSESQRQRDRLKVSALYLQGKTQWEISEIVGIAQGTVSNDLKAIQKKWIASSLVNIDKVKAEDLAKIDQLEREAWEAWEKSKADKTIKSKKQSNISDGERTELSIRTENMHGDPRYWQGIQWCIEKRIKIFGLDAPEKLEIFENKINIANSKLQEYARNLIQLDNTSKTISE